MPHSDFYTHTNHHYRFKLFKHKPTAFDILITIVSVLYPLSALPQAIEVFSGRTQGVSILSWLMFALCATLFLIYGLKHRVAPMIISNVLWIIMDLAVVIGLLISYMN